jgi:hypothetical protein
MRREAEMAHSLIAVRPIVAWLWAASPMAHTALASASKRLLNTVWEYRSLTHITFKVKGKVALLPRGSQVVRKLSARQKAICCV